jgi:hypothetical protein
MLHGSTPNYYFGSLQLGGYSKITSACFARSQARGLLTYHYSTWLIQLSYLGGLHAARVLR